MKTVVSPVRCPASNGTEDFILYTYNILGLSSGIVWGPKFRLEEDAGNAPGKELARHCPPQDFQRFEEFQRECFAGVTEDELIAAIKGLENQVELMRRDMDDEEGDANCILINIEEVKHNIRNLQHSLELKTQVWSVTAPEVDEVK